MPATSRSARPPPPRVCKAVGILHQEGREETGKPITAGVVAGGGKVVAEASAPATNPDMSAPVAKLVDAKADCIALSLPTTLTVQAYTAIKQNGAAVKIIGVGDNVQASVRKDLGALATGSYIVSTATNPDDPAAKVIPKILADLQTVNPSRTKADVDLYAVNAWAAAHILAAGVAKVTGDVTPASLLTAMNSLQNVDVQDAIHAFSATPVATSKQFSHFFNHYARLYQIQADGSLVVQGDWVDFGAAMP